jgi:hypothetical protein
MYLALFFTLAAAFVFFWTISRNATNKKDDTNKNENKAKPKKHPFTPFYRHDEQDLAFLTRVFDECITIENIHRISRDEEADLRYRYGKQYMKLNNLTEYTHDTDRVEYDIAYAINRAINYKLAKISPSLAFLNGNPMA